MRILLLNTTCKIGGVSTFMVSLRRALVAAGHTCELFFLEHGPMEPHLPSDARVHFGSLTDLLRLVARERFDVLHANNVDWWSGISAVRRLGTRLVVTAHKVRDTAWTYGWTTRDCDAFVAVSEWIRRDLQPFTDVPIRVVPNGIDTGRFAPGPGREAVTAGPPIVAWVGRGGARRKRLEVFAAAAPALAAAGLRIWVIDQQGPDALTDAFPDEARTLRTCAERWEGVPFDEMPQVYRDVAASGGCLVSTASMEGLPLALLEAQACGCVVVAADVLGVNECVTPEHGGILYPATASSTELAAVIVEATGDSVKMRARQQEAASYVRAEFSLERMAEAYLTRVYQSAAAPAIPLVQQLRGRWRLVPFVRHAGYLHQRWGVGNSQYEAGRELASGAEWELAAAAGRASMRAAPTLYLKPRRLLDVIQWHLRARMTRGGGVTGSVPA